MLKMPQKIFFIKLLLVHYTTQSNTGIQANCNDHVSLKCSEDDIRSMDFISVAWYKVNIKNKHGIVRRNKGETRSQVYNFNRKANLEERYSLFLPAVKPEDSGTYECSISGNVGHQNLHYQVELTVHECVTQAELTTDPTVIQSTLTGKKEAEDLQIVWIIGIYVAVAIIKIFLCLIPILVFRKRSSKPWKHCW